jgi:L-aspartate oxidase
VQGVPRYLLSEALRGEGAHLLNCRGERFMERYEPAGELAPRDRVARAIVREAERTGESVYLSLAHLPPDFVHAKFPLITDLCRRAGQDHATDRIPIAPAAHYLMGGIATDLAGRTSIPGLFAAGEVACTGVHGANRLASNSLLEGLVFGARAGTAMRGWTWEPWPDALAPATSDPPPIGPAFDVRTTEADVRELMWNTAGIFRDRQGLQKAMGVLDSAWQAIARGLAGGGSLDASGWQRASLVTVGRLIARAALQREESRGAHSRTDFPERDDLHWKRHLIDRRDPFLHSEAL